MHGPVGNFLHRCRLPFLRTRSFVRSCQAVGRQCELWWRHILILSTLAVAGNVKLQLRAPFRSEYVKPSAKLEALIIPLRPISSKLAPLEGPRDQLPRSHTPHGLTLTYKLKLEEAGKITPRLPMLNGYAPISVSIPPFASVIQTTGVRVYVVVVSP